MQEIERALEQLWGGFKVKPERIALGRSVLNDLLTPEQQLELVNADRLKCIDGVWWLFAKPQ